MEGWEMRTLVKHVLEVFHLDQGVVIQGFEGEGFVAELVPYFGVAGEDVE